ncbi:sugar 3,4-ketoisomerase [Bacteroides intestinalis]|jgi:hypothetical protein|uniref:sugar 3,4-ketoisomerase n=1 Tax=Bacteroides intestinalis TaxID=329854 RepID=UPI00189E7B78|nr:FdtA/QdtA family cupin domain-containing protein [Bacteroides intestinalis]
MEEPQLIELPIFADPRGNLSFAEQNNHIPFEIQRTYWIYDVPGGESRGGHAFKETNEFIIAISGCFDVTVDDGKNKQTFRLDRSYYGLFIPRGFWRTMDNFSTNSLALEFADTKYDRNDYVMEYEDYLKMKSNGEI